MKKIFLFALCALMFLFCAGFGLVKTVPEKTLEWVVDDYLDWNQYIGGKYTDYQYKITHDPDKSTNTDTVTIDLTITYPHVTASSNYEMTYQYDKSRDLWEELRGPGWDVLHIDTYDITSSSRLWMQAFESEGWEFELKAEGSSFAESLIANVNDGLKTACQTGWCIDAFYPIESDLGPQVRVYSIEFDDESTAQELLITLRDVNFNHIPVLGEAMGDNYFFSLLSKYGYRESSCLLIRQDKTVFCISSDAPAGYDYAIYSVLQQVGFVDETLTAG